MMLGRPVVSYDDITLPYDQPETSSATALSSSHTAQGPPNKKRKRNNNNKKRRENSRPNPNSQSAFSGNTNHYSVKISSSLPQQSYVAEGEVEVHGPEGEYDYEEEGEEEESRELTHEEIWDDSALVNAWEAAMEEYEAFHGPDKDWKKEPVKKSPLWYNVPIDPSQKQKKKVSIADDDDTEANSKPLDFDTFVPTHDPSLDIPPVPSVSLYPPTSMAETASTKDSGAVPGSTSYIPDSCEPMVSQDEAFQRAMSAMYWGGYWTAMYHAQRQMQTSMSGSTQVEVPVTANAEEQDDQEEIEDQEELDYEGEEIVMELEELEGQSEGEVEEEGDSFVSTQR